MFELYPTVLLDRFAAGLREHVDRLNCWPLNIVTLSQLSDWQAEQKLEAGIYILYYKSEAVFVGKSTTVIDTLKDCRLRLSGRRNLDASKIEFKCLLFGEDKISTARDLLFRSILGASENWWEGFGPHDPGRRRDKTKLNKFDLDHPINCDFQVSGVCDSESLKSLAIKMKGVLPYTFRFELGDQGAEIIDLTNVERTADKLIREMVNVLGEGWRGGRIGHGYVLYKDKTNYEEGGGENIDPRISRP